MGYFREFKGVPIWEKDPSGKSAPRKFFEILIWLKTSKIDHSIHGGGVGRGWDLGGGWIR